MPALPLYFTFLDGAFRYDCAACGQACCRGKGIAIDAGRELVPLLRRAPRLAPLVLPLGGGYVRLPDATDGCWFLRDDGMCSYEQEHGRAAKFTTCRLFPFNRVFRAGAVRVVDFNSVVCPLEDAQGSGVSYRELAAELEAVGEGPLVNSAAELPEGARELRWHALEQELLEGSSIHLAASDYRDYAAWQIVRTSRHLGQPPRDATVVGAEISMLLESWTQLYGLALDDALVAPLGQATARALTLLTPSLRFNLLFKKGGGGYRQQLEQLPRQLLATWLLGTLAAFMQKRPLSLRSLTELHQAHAPLRDLLGRLAEPAQLERPLVAPDMPDAVAAALRNMSRALTAARRPSLGQVLLEAAADLPIESRALLPTLLLRAGDGLRFDSTGATSR